MSPENEGLAALLGYSHHAVKRIDGVFYDYLYPVDWLCSDIEHDCGDGHELPDWHNSMDARLREALTVAQCLTHAVGACPPSDECPEARGAEEVKCRYARAALLNVEVVSLAVGGLAAIKALGASRSP